MTRKLRWSGALTTAALAVAAQAPPATANITFEGIGPASLDMSGEDVRETLGPPSASHELRGRDAVVLIYRRRKLEVTLHRGRNRLVAVKTTSRAQRTASGLGVGSTDRAVRTRLRDEKCSTAAGHRVCSVERAGIVMDFECRRGRVVRVGVTRITTG